ncbi:MAG: hypothetical protein OXG35_05485, partial [Acidobacteria bacterium]|nr:hypothetical protein [Acidobacteriota bacterium]
MFGRRWCLSIRVQGRQGGHAADEDGGEQGRAHARRRLSTGAWHPGVRKGARTGRAGAPVGAAELA